MSIPNCIIETDEWKLGCYFQWREKYHRVDCTDCNGKGMTSGRFDLDGPSECKTCGGLGWSSKSPTTRPPEIPEALKEHMRRAWWDFVNGQVAGDNNAEVGR